jgi:hypothetical protein
MRATGSDEEQATLAGLIQEEVGSSGVTATLQTDQRVMARITDGIYRHPSSALRELVSNAYDADASQVVIRLDRPRFATISVEDDGAGMSIEALVRMLYHIGGSSKRTRVGESFGVTGKDSVRSPRGRPLIGKSGIGLFSVAQLTTSFQIITKVEGSSFRTVARVNLKQYSESGEIESEDESTYEAGRVRIWKEHAVDVEAHGTTVILDSIRPSTRNTLRSAGKWEILRSASNDIRGPGGSVGVIPRINVGAVDPNDADMLSDETDLPWERGDRPEDAFRRLVYALASTQESRDRNPSVESEGDEYINLVWKLASCCPLEYLEGHPFELSAGSGFRFFQYDASRGSSDEIELGGRTVRECMGNPAPADTADPPFRVIVDDLELRRPVLLRDFPATGAVLQDPILLFGDCYEKFPSVPIEVSGGPLEFTGYLMWAPKMTPVENRGVVVRVNNATGMSRDVRFFDYPKDERTKLPQISGEIFVTKGFDGALNIDRESFNYAHPHAVVVTRWIHGALADLIAVQKRLTAVQARNRKRDEDDTAQSRTDAAVEALWDSVFDGEINPPAVSFETEGEIAWESGSVSLPRALLAAPGENIPSGGRRDRRERTLASLVQILESLDSFGEMRDEQRRAVIESVVRVLTANGLW